MSGIEQEEEHLYRDYEAGLITSAELNRELRELQRDYANAARESAQKEYDREMERWYY